jgi:hypothetical protein
VRRANQLHLAAPVIALLHSLEIGSKKEKTKMSGHLEHGAQKCERFCDNTMRQNINLEPTHRRGFLKRLLGLTALAICGSSLLNTGSAEAAPKKLPEPIVPEPALADPEQDLPETEPVQMYQSSRRSYTARAPWRRRVVYRRVVYRRPVYRRVYYRQPVRRVYYRRPVRRFYFSF